MGKSKILYLFLTLLFLFTLIQPFQASAVTYSCTLQYRIAGDVVKSWTQTLPYSSAWPSGINFSFSPDVNGIYRYSSSSNGSQTLNLTTNNNGQTIYANFTNPSPSVTISSPSTTTYVVAAGGTKSISISGGGTNVHHLCGFVNGTALVTQNGTSYSTTYVATSPGTYNIYIAGRNAAGYPPWSLLASSATRTVKLVTPDPTYTVTYSGNGNTGGTAPSSQTWTAGNTLTLRTNTGSLTKTGYTLSGWNTNSSGTGATYSLGQANVNLGSSNITLYAKWTPNTYTVTYSGNGNTGGTAPSSQTWTAGNTLTLQANTGSLTKTGYTLSGWNTNSSGTGTTYSLGQANVNLGSSNITLYAKWDTSPQPPTYPTVDIVFSNIGGGTGNAPNLQDPLNKVGLNVNNCAMVKLTDLSQCIGGVLTVNDTNWIITLNGQSLSFKENNNYFTSSITYSISDPQTGQTHNYTHTFSGFSDVAAQIINGEKYVQLSCAAHQLGALIVYYDSINNRIVVYDWRVSGVSGNPLSDPNTYLVGGPWLTGWSSKGTNALSPHFSFSEMWDESDYAGDYQYQLKIAKKQIQCAENVRFHYNNSSPLVLTCAFRSWNYNRHLSGAYPKSLHMKGLAWDASGAALYISVFDEFCGTLTWPKGDTNTNIGLWETQLQNGGNSGGLRIEKMENDSPPVKYELKSRPWLHLEAR